MELKKTVLGLELGSTRIKAVLLNENHIPVASGSYEWENQLENGVWTYSLSAIHTGVQACYRALAEDAARKFGQPLTQVGAIGVSAMMHGYMPFDKDWQLLTPFRTWRNTMTGPAAAELTELFSFNIPQRWSIAHLYQAMKNGEEHLPRLAHLTTLAGYIHTRLTGRHVLGVGEAAGMFPIESGRAAYHREMSRKFDTLTASMGYSFTLADILPQVVMAGEDAGTLTEAGARFLDPTGTLQAGIPVAPPEGDAGTGMTATNSVRAYTGNVSAGTSDFAMVVVDRPLGVHREIDMVATPTGLPVAMVHCNNCTSDLNAWAGLLGEFAALLGVDIGRGALLDKLFAAAMQGAPDGGGLLSYNYLSGEGVTDLDAGRPVFTRTPSAPLTLPNFMRTHLLSALATLKIGLDILTGEEQVDIRRLCGHGGFFKAPLVGQTLLSAAVNAPVTVMETAGEGGPYGMALLAQYLTVHASGKTLEDFLQEDVFRTEDSSVYVPTAAECAAYRRYLEQHHRGLAAEHAAVDALLAAKE